MEMHHCEETIDIMSNDQCNLFSDLDSKDFRWMWNTVIQLILATDMAKHFNILKEFDDIYNSGQWDMEKEENRQLLMQMLIKVSDISNVSRPFELADRWCDVLCEEFFRQGDLEQARGMKYTSDLNDREHLDKPKSQIGFYTFVCLPLYQAVAKALPPLQANANQVESNLANWREAAEHKKEDSSHEEEEIPEVSSQMRIRPVPTARPLASQRRQSTQRSFKLSERGREKTKERLVKEKKDKEKTTEGKDADKNIGKEQKKDSEQNN